jgi:hypothetical protein
VGELFIGELDSWRQHRKYGCLYKFYGLCHTVCGLFSPRRRLKIKFRPLNAPLIFSRLLPLHTQSKFKSIQFTLNTSHTSQPAPKNYPSTEHSVILWAPRLSLLVARYNVFRNTAIKSLYHFLFSSFPRYRHLEAMIKAGRPFRGVQRFDAGIVEILSWKLWQGVFARRPNFVCFLPRSPPFEKISLACRGCGIRVIRSPPQVAKLSTQNT